MFNPSPSYIEMIPVLLTKERTIGNQVEFAWKEFLGDGTFGRTSSGRYDSFNCDINEFEFAAVPLPGVSPPDIQEYPYPAFVVLHRIKCEGSGTGSGGWIERYTLLITEGVPERTCDRNFHAIIISSTPSTDIATKWEYTIAETVLDSENEWEEKRNLTDYIDNTDFTPQIAYNILEKNNTNSLAYGYEINDKDPPELKNSPGFRLMPVPNNTLIKVRSICTYDGGPPRNYFSAVNPIDGFCQSGPLVDPA